MLVGRPFRARPNCINMFADDLSVPANGPLQRALLHDDCNVVTSSGMADDIMANGRICRIPGDRRGRFCRVMLTPSSPTCALYRRCATTCRIQTTRGRQTTILIPMPMQDSPKLHSTTGYGVVPIWRHLDIAWGAIPRERKASPTTRTG